MKLKLLIATAIGVVGLPGQTPLLMCAQLGNTEIVPGCPPDWPGCRAASLLQHERGLQGIVSYGNTAERLASGPPVKNQIPMGWGADTELRDDGQGADRIAGDGVYTIGPLGGRSTAATPPTYCWDPNSPAGVDTVDLGRVLVVETDGSTNEFLVEPAVGMLRTEVALVPTIQLSSTIQRSAHVINLRSSSRTTQSALRFLGGRRMADLTAPLYAMFPDAFDFLVFFSSYSSGCRGSRPRTSMRESTRTCA